MHYFNVILLSEVIWAFAPKVTGRVTYVNPLQRPYLKHTITHRSNIQSSNDLWLFCLTTPAQNDILIYLLQKAVGVYTTHLII